MALSNSWPAKRPLFETAHRGDHKMEKQNMKYVCLGYYDEKKFEALPESERNAMLDSCFDYDDELRKNGHFAGGGSTSKRTEYRHLALEER
jgi:hypothetical protein